MRASKKQLDEAIAVLQKGGVVVFPTETAYGLAADATDAKAVRKVFAIKGRGAEKSVPLIASDRAMAERYIHLTPSLRMLAKRHWPGPLTIVGLVRFGLAPGAVRKDGTVAIRVSSHPIARALSRALNSPIVATSANVAAQPTCYSVRAVQKQFATRRLRPDFYVDVGALPRREPSTLVKEEDGELIMLRQGSVRLSLRGGAVPTKQSSRRKLLRPSASQ
jgi:L-threonylcarbamoyladenylate synthase